jgi:hypothetical protein
MQGLNLQTATTNIAEMIRGAKKLKDEEIGRAFAKGLILSEYVFDKFISKPKIKKIDSLSFHGKKTKKNFRKESRQEG